LSATSIGDDSTIRPRSSSTASAFSEDGSAHRAASASRRTTRSGCGSWRAAAATEGQAFDGQYLPGGFPSDEISSQTAGLDDAIAKASKFAEGFGYRLSHWLVPVSGPSEKGGTADG
jgi:hypothetical protein